MPVAILIILITLTFGCTKQKLDRSDWENFAYPKFSKQVNQTAGLGAVNCGHFNLLNSRDRQNMKKIAPKCVAASLNIPEPFKFGTITITGDVYLYSAVVFDPQKNFWLVKLDVMLDGSEANLRVEKCNSIQIEFDPIFYDRDGCASIDPTEWLAK